MELSIGDMTFKEVELSNHVPADVDIAVGSSYTIHPNPAMSVTWCGVTNLYRPTKRFVAAGFDEDGNPCLFEWDTETEEPTIVKPLED